MRNEVLKDIEFGRGEYRITNVPHIQEDITRTGLDYTVRSSVQSRVSSIYEYMRKYNINEFDYITFDKLNIQNERED